MKGRGKLILLALIFMAPLALAAWLYYSGSALTPTGRTNAGTLLEPIVELNTDEEAFLSTLPADQLVEGNWLLIYAESGPCGDACRDELVRLRQIRLMLGNDMQRVVRLFLHGENAPDTVWLEEQHPGLITIQNDELMGVLTQSRPSATGPGGLFLVDPLGNLVMHFANTLNPALVLEDIEHLLELSRIG